VLWRIYPLVSGDCKQRLLLGNARKIHTHNNRRTGLCNFSLNNCSVNTFPQQRIPMQQKKNGVLCVVRDEVLQAVVG
jgi:hypothetical protein